MSTEIVRRKLVTTANIVSAINASQETSEDGDILRIDRAKLPASLVANFPGESGTVVVDAAANITSIQVKGCTVEKIGPDDQPPRYRVHFDVPFVDTGYFFFAIGYSEQGALITLPIGSTQTNTKTIDSCLIYYVPGLKEITFVAQGEKAHA